MPTTPVDDYYVRYTDLLGSLKASNQVSLYDWVSDYLRRILVLVSANHFENEIRGAIGEFIRANSDSPMATAFSLSSMERQYHTYFNWKAKNANTFFAMFGDEFKQQAEREVAGNTELDDSIKAFLEIGRTRNELSHERMHEVPLPKTGDEYYALHVKAVPFIEFVRRKFGLVEQGDEQETEERQTEPPP